MVVLSTPPVTRPRNPPRLPKEAGSLRWDGRVTTGTIAKEYGVTVRSVMEARRAGRLTGWWHKGRYWYDPAQVTHRKDGRPGPVDKGHPDAVPQQVRLHPDLNHLHGPAHKVLLTVAGPCDDAVGDGLDRHHVRAVH